MNRRRSRWRSASAAREGRHPAGIGVAAFGVLVLCSGCMFLPGPEGLEAIRAKRPEEPYARAVFRAEPEPGERGTAELRATMTYWAGTGADGRPRWSGVLEPHPEDLYSLVIDAIDRGAAELTLISYRYDALGLDDLTLVDYYDERGTRLGWDFVVYHELPRRTAERTAVGYDDLEWWEYPQMLLDIPVYALLGLKELVGEIVKSPFSAVDSGWLGPGVEGRSPFSPVCFERAGGAFLEDWRNGFTALGWRFRVRTRHTPLDLARELLGAVPVIGPVFDHKSPPPGTGTAAETASGTASRRELIAVSPGIHAGGRNEQHSLAWAKALHEIRPDARVVVSPYRYGGFFDTTWSLLNLSHGIGYDAARHLLFEEGVRSADRISVVGFSGSAQRFVAATRLLRGAGVHVELLVGVAGPIAGFSCAAESCLLLGDRPLLDPVVLSAHTVNALLFPLPTNVQTVRVRGAGGHHLPWFPDGATRAPSTGYGRELERRLARRRR